MQLINNGGIYSNKNINEYFLIYNLFDYQYINFQGEGKFLFYNMEVNFDIINEGLNPKYFYSINLLDKKYYSIGLLIYVDIKAGDYFQTNLYPDPKLNSQKEYNSYFISNMITKIFNYNCIITFNTVRNDNKKINIKTAHTNETFIVNGYIDRKFHSYKNEEITITPSGPLIIYFTKEKQDKNILFISRDDVYYENSLFLKFILPNIQENYTFYKGYGFFITTFGLDSEIYMNQMREFNIPLNSDKEIRLYMDVIPKKEIPYKRIIYGLSKTYYSNFIEYDYFLPPKSHYRNNISRFPYYSNCINNTIIYKCRNKKVNLHIGNDKFYKEYIWESTDSFYNFNLSKYNLNNSYCILEINANSAILIFEGIDSRKTNNISTYNEEFNSTDIFLINEEPVTYTMKRYIFSPKNDLYKQNFMDECFLYDVIVGNKKDINITITNSSNFTTALKKGCKEYLVTVVYKSSNNYYYFYKPSIIKVSQKVLDEVFPEPIEKKK